MIDENSTRERTEHCKAEPGDFAPVVDFGRCEGKADCVSVCPVNVFEIRQIEPADYRSLNLLHKFKLRVHGLRVAYTPNAGACENCGLCVSACPERAITLKRRSGTSAPQPLL